MTSSTEASPVASVPVEPSRSSPSPASRSTRRRRRSPERSTTPRCGSSSSRSSRPGCTSPLACSAPRCSTRCPFGAVHAARDSTGVIGAACLASRRRATRSPVAPGDPGRAAWRSCSPRAEPRRRLDALPRARRTGCTRRICTGTSRSSASTRRHQGEGVGARLIDHTLERLDREGCPRTSRPTRSRTSPGTRAAGSSSARRCTPSLPVHRSGPCGATRPDPQPTRSERRGTGG